MAIFFVFLAVTLSTANEGSKAQGIAIYKKSTAHPDSGATVFEFTGVLRSGEVTQYITLEGLMVELNLFQPQVTITYPVFMSLAITGPDQLGPIKDVAQSFRGNVAKYPQSGPFLNRYIEAADSIVRRVNGGDVLYNGAWMSHADYETLIRKEDAEANKFRDRSKEKKRVAEEQARRRDLETRRHKQ